MSGVDLEQLAWTEIDRPPLLLVPVGSCEQHGSHLPVGTDTTIASMLAREVAARRADCLVAPALTITASGEHQGFPGTLSIGTDVLVNVLVELVRSAEWAAGVVFVNGHGGNREAMRRASHVFEHEHRRVTIWWPDLRGLADAADLHAGHVETSLLLALQPDAVRFGAATAGPATPPSIVELVERGVRAVSPSGVLGDPTTATAAGGLRLFAALAGQLAAAIGP